MPFKNLFGRNKTPQTGSSDNMSLAQVMVAEPMNRTLDSQKCDICGATFLMPDSHIKVVGGFSENATGPDFIIDVGGYCVHCQKAMCHKHTKWIHDPNETEPSLIKYTWVVGCANCSQPLIGSHGMDLVAEKLQQLLSILKDPEATKQFLANLKDLNNK